MFLSSQEFSELKKRYADYEKEGFPGNDKGMNDIISSLNKIEGLVTIYCCEGHFDPDQWNKTKKSSSRFYILFGVLNVSALNTVHKLYQKLFDHTFSGKEYTNLEFSRNVWPTDFSTTNQRWYDTIVLEIIYPTTPLYEAKIKHDLLEKVRKYIKEL